MTAIVESQVGGYIGSRERKQYGDRFLTGRIEYINDVRLPGTVHAVIERVAFEYDPVRRRPVRPVAVPIAGRAARERPDERDDDEAPQPPHVSRLPTVRVTPTRTTPATNQATSPSGTGPTWPSDHPPRSYGASAYCT